MIQQGSTALTQFVDIERGALDVQDCRSILDECVWRRSSGRYDSPVDARHLAPLLVPMISTATRYDVDYADPSVQRGALQARVLKYVEGDACPRHDDIHPGEVRVALSLIVGLNPHYGWEGGELSFDYPPLNEGTPLHSKTPPPLAFEYHPELGPGDAVIFHPEVRHGVTRIESGVRYVLTAFWREPVR